MRRAVDHTSPDTLVVASSVVSGVLAFLDLLGPDLAIWDDWGGASLFSFGTVLAFLVPTAVVVRIRRERRAAGRAWARWPDVILGTAATALVASVAAHIIGEGAVPGLLAAVAGSAAIAYAATRLPT